MTTAKLAASLVLCLVAGQRAKAQIGPRPAFSASPLKATVLCMEPIWVRIEVTNRSDQPVAIVPPYINCYERANWPVTFLVTRGDGTVLINGWPHAKTGIEPVAFGPLPWWIPSGPRARGRSPRPRRPWEIEAGSSAFMWFDLLRFYPLRQPGRYHVLLRYRPQSGMCTNGSEERGRTDALSLSDVDMDAGWIEVLEAKRADAEAAQFLLQAHETRDRVMHSDGDASICREVLERFPDSTHAVHAEFFLAWGAPGPPPWPAEAHIGFVHESERFRARHPHFPLLPKLDLARVYALWASAAYTDMAAHMDDPAPDPVSKAHFHTVKARISAVEDDLRAAIAGTRDFEFRQFAELHLWWWHEWRAQNGVE